MILKGKCKEAFEEWLCDNYPNCGYIDLLQLSYSMQYGVLVDFFDSVGIDLTAGLNYCHVYQRYPRYIYKRSDVSRQEARTSAIEKANEIFNNI